VVEVYSLGFKILNFRVWGTGFRSKGLELQGFRIERSGFKVQG
jgi:hypothetical protein